MKFLCLQKLDTDIVMTVIFIRICSDGNSRRLSWVENRTYNPDNASSTEVWHHEIEFRFVSSSSDSSTSLYNLCIDGNGNLFAVGESKIQIGLQNIIFWFIAMGINNIQGFK